MTHTFDSRVATVIGVDSAIFLQNLSFWIAKNAADEKHYHDGYTWTFGTIKSFSELMPYFTERQIRYILDKLTDNGYILKGNYNEDKRDRTQWYAITDVGNRLLYGLATGCDNFVNCKAKLNIYNNITDNIEPYDNLVLSNDNTKLSSGYVCPNPSDSDAMPTGAKRKSPQEIADMYNAICVSFPKCTILSDHRVTAIRTRQRRYTDEQFETMFRKAEASSFLKGCNNHDWRASFDWMIKDSNFAKIYSGNYDDHDSEQSKDALVEEVARIEAEMFGG